MHPRTTIERFDAYLASQGLAFEAVVIGGAALALLGVADRVTRDCDVLHPGVPPEVKVASVAFARVLRREGLDVADNWLNIAPADLARTLPDGWQNRMVLVLAGAAAKLWCLGRSDLLRSKLFALCDRGRDLSDCLALVPTAEELADLEPWVAAQSGNPDWPEHVRLTLADLCRRLGHAP
jgi:hypothetical protein